MNCSAAATYYCYSANSELFNSSSDNQITTQNNSDNNANKKNDKDLAFVQWLAGLIDGDGYFILTKKGYASCEITMDARDKKALYEIKQKYGGSVKLVSNANALRYKLRHKKGLISLINDVNGLLRNPTRLLQINKLCVKYNIELKYPKPLTFSNGWLSGFIDSDGSIYFSEASGQVFIGVSQKNRYLLEPLISLYGGRIDILSPKIEAFKYIIYRKLELFNLIDTYLSRYPLKTEKMKRVNLIKEFYALRVHRKSEDIKKFNEWRAPELRVHYLKIGASLEKNIKINKEMVQIILDSSMNHRVIAIRYDGYCCRIIILQSGFISLS